jgi:hypothetical protein
MDTATMKNQTNPNVGDLSRPKGEASPLRYQVPRPEGTSTLLPFLSAISLETTDALYLFTLCQNKPIFYKSVPFIPKGSVKFYALGTVVPSFVKTKPILFWSLVLRLQTNHCIYLNYRV